MGNSNSLRAEALWPGWPKGCTSLLSEGMRLTRLPPCPQGHLPHWQSEAALGLAGPCSSHCIRHLPYSLDPLLN